jgi:CheY-like chemotaxis protein
MTVRCVIVDDSRDFVRAARDLLDGEGIAVVGVASTGEQACRACRELSPDVVLIDLDLGQESGLDVAGQLRGQHAGGQQPRMILISAYSGEDIADMIAGRPAISFLPKAHLSVAAVRGILARADGSAG